MKILNLYAGLGGNRKLWGDEHEVTAVEYIEEIADIYKDLFPKDKVIVGDAEKYLLEHYKEFDFIWASPPCPSHSRIRMMASKAGSYLPILPDMKLYSIITFLQHFCKDRFWVIENVKPYYKPLIEPTIILDRHCFWSNFDIKDYPKELPKLKIRERNHNKITGKTQIYGFDLTKYKMKHRKDQVIRNMVNPELALHIFKQIKEARQ